MKALAIVLALVAGPALAANDSPAEFNVHTAKGGAQAGAAGALTGALGDIVQFFATDFDDAAKLATEIPALQDNNGKACWTQASSIGALLRIHPLPLTFKAATDFEALRLFSMAVNQMCANPACTQVFTDLSNGVAQVGVGIPIPSLTSLCAKVPNITPGAPVATPASPAAN